MTFWDWANLHPGDATFAIIVTAVLLLGVIAGLFRHRERMAEITSEYTDDTDDEDDE